MNRPKTILVTGATGFVGRYVVDSLRAMDEVRVVATARNSPTAEQAEQWPDVTFVPFDLGADWAGQDLFAHFNRPDAVIHLAWEGLPDYKSMAHIDTYWLRHYRFLTNLITHGLTDLTVTGTCLEYGLQSGCLSEDLPAQPTTAYGLAKDMLRRSLTLFLTGRDVSFKWIRLFYMYGAGQNPRSLLAQLEAAVRRGDTVFNMSGGEQLRDYLLVSEVGKIICQASVQQRISGIINGCSGQPVAVRTFVERFMLANNYQLDLNLGYYPYPDYEPLAFWGDNQKLLTLLNG